MRKGQTYFINASSFTNIDILTPEYVRRLLDGALELHDFLKSVVGMRPGLRRDTRFYIAFGERHKYTDGTRYGEPAESCLDLRFLRRGEPSTAAWTSVTSCP